MAEAFNLHIRSAIDQELAQMTGTNVGVVVSSCLYCILYSGMPPFK